MGSNGYDVVVVGAGNAAMCAAMAVAGPGRRVLVLEKAPASERGGNSYFTGGGYRFAYDGMDQVHPLIPDLSDWDLAHTDVGSYTEDQYYDDMLRVTEYQTDPELANFLVTRSYPAMRWMQQQGMTYALMTGRQAFKVGDVFRFWGGLTVEGAGGGPGISDRWFALAKPRGIPVSYETRARKLLQDRRGTVTGVEVETRDGREEIPAKAVVIASGGFEANPALRSQWLGPRWDQAKVRGTRHNVGDGILMALEAGAQPYGNWSGCHAVAWDLNAPTFGDRKVGDGFQKHSYPFGLIVNLHGERFVDEGADFRNYTYAKYGRDILQQPERTAFQLFDQKVMDLLRAEYRIPQITKASADTIGELADKLGIDRAGLERTVADYNAAVLDGDFNPTVKDGKSTAGIAPPKTNWAQRLDTPPYEGYAVTCGITFTFGGLKVNTRAEVLDMDDRPIRGLYAAGELVGGLFAGNYPGGAGLMSGSVFGRAAGESAVEYLARS